MLFSMKMLHNHMLKLCLLTMAYSCISFLFEAQQLQVLKSQGWSTWKSMRIFKGSLIKITIKAARTWQSPTMSKVRNENVGDIVWYVK